MSTSTFWWLILGTAALTAVLKAAGPVALGGRELPDRFSGVVVLLAAPLMAALVVTSAFADGDRLQVDSATAGIAVGGLLLWRRAPLVVGVLSAAVVTALLRLAGLP